MNVAGWVMTNFPPLYWVGVSAMIIGILILLDVFLTERFETGYRWITLGYIAHVFILEIPGTRDLIGGRRVPSVR